MTAFREHLQRLPPWLRRSLWGIAACYALYLLAGNVFLNTPLFDLVTDHKPERFTMDTGPALTLLPGVVTVWDVRIRGHVQRTRYSLRAERVTGRMALLPLLHREVEVPWIRVHGVTIEADLVEQRIPSPPRSDQGWTLRFDAIHSDSIRSARFEKLMLVGRGSATVGFLKQLHGGPSELFASHAEFADASLAYAGLNLIDQAKLAGDFSYPRHYREQAPGIAKLAIMQMKLHLDGRSLALKVDTGGGQVKVGVLPAQSRIEADLDLARGELQSGSRMVWRLPVLAGVGATDRGMLALQLDVARDIRVQARLPKDPKTGSELHADLHVAGRQLLPLQPAALLPRVSGQVQAVWRFESLTWISQLLVRKPWFALDGGGVVDADLRVEQGKLAEGTRVDVPDVEAVANVMGNRAHGRASAKGRIVDDRAVIDVAMAEFDLAPAEQPDKVFVKGRDLRMQLAGDRELRHLPDTLQAKVDFSNAQVPDITAYNRYLPGGNVRLLAGSGRLGADLSLDAAGVVAHGNTQLRGDDVRLSLAGVEMKGAAELDVHLKRADLQRKLFDLTGSRVQLRHMQVAGDDVRDWWATLDLPHGRIDAATPFQVDADAQVRMKDAGLMLALFSRKADYPKWIFKFVDAGQVQAHGRLRWRREQLVIDDLQAENERVSMRARLQIGSDERHGDLYLRWGLLGVGVELDNGQRSWHVAGARDWFDDQPALLPPASSNALRNSD